jgi:hypothetical protein
MLHPNTNTRDQLAAVEDRLRRLRDERGRLAKLLEAAKSAVAEHEGDATLGAAVAAKDAVQAVEQQIEAAQDEQISQLRALGDHDAGRSGFAFAGVDGWETAARKLSLSTGELRVDVVPWGWSRTARAARAVCDESVRNTRPAPTRGELVLTNGLTAGSRRRRTATPRRGSSHCPGRIRARSHRRSWHEGTRRR